MQRIAPLILPGVEDHLAAAAAPKVTAARRGSPSLL
jgi:hypothetical protein